jgi:hypothetical protein
MSTDAPRSALTLLGDPEATACEGDACLVPSAVAPGSPERAE